MPVGPLQLTDEISIDLSVNIIKATKSALGADYHASAADDILFKLAKENRLGRKNGAGFYEYDEKGRRAGLWQGLGKEWPVKPDVLDLTTIQHRMAFAQTLEAIRAFEDGSADGYTRRRCPPRFSAGALCRGRAARLAGWICWVPPKPWKSAMI